jgi:hypothetical protein
MWLDKVRNCWSLWLIKKIWLCCTESLEPEPSEPEPHRATAVASPKPRCSGFGFATIMETVLVSLCRSVDFLKWPWNEISDLCFFSSNNFPWVPDTQVKAFSNMASNARSNRQSWLHSGVNSGVIDNAVTCTAVSLTPLWLGPHIREVLATFKENTGIYWKNIHRHIDLHYTYNFHAKNMGLTRDRFCHSGVIGSAGTKIGDVQIFIKALTRVSGA